MRVGVLASGEGTNLQALLDTRPRPARSTWWRSPPTSPSARALERAAAAGVPARVFLRSEYGARAERDAAIADWLLAEGVELVVLAGYMAILDAGFVARFPDRILNVHPSLLPAFPGVRAIEQAVEHGVQGLRRDGPPRRRGGRHGTDRAAARGRAAGRDATPPRSMRACARSSTSCCRARSR